MVNYCCVQGCGRNSKQNKHLNYYSLPKERRRQVQWLQAAGRADLLEKDKVLVSHRFCSRHFTPSSIKNKHLCDTAVPTLFLPGASGEDDEVHKHVGIVCNNCGTSVAGFRYKCVSCEDFDLCAQCEARETHPDHYMLRMPKPLKYKLADELIAKWRAFFAAKHATPDSDSDDEPITKYRNSGLDLSEEMRKIIRDEKLADELISKWRAFFTAKHATPDSDSDDEPITKYRNSGLDLSEEMRKIIRNEVARVSDLPETKSNSLLMSKRRMGEEIQRSIKRIRMDGTIGYDDEDNGAPEVVFADVNADNQLLEVKNETPIDGEWKRMVHVKVSDDMTELMIEVPHLNRVETSTLQVCDQ